jgi:ribosomal protein S18 acetylase RimI-like enzyme
VTVRRAVGGDAHALAALNRAVHDMHLARRPDYFKATRADEVTAWFRDRLDEPTTAAWIAEAEGRPVGYVLTFFHDRGENAFCRPRRWCEIDQIAVDSAWRRRGVGRALMAAALAEAETRGLRSVELFSWAFNTDAHAMFQRLGFEPRMLRFERRAP